MLNPVHAPNCCIYKGRGINIDRRAKLSDNTFTSLLISQFFRYHPSKDYMYFKIPIDVNIAEGWVFEFQLRYTQVVNTGSDSSTAKRSPIGVCHGSSKMNIINGCHRVPSIGQHLQSFTGDRLVTSPYVKNSRV